MPARKKSTTPTITAAGRKPRRETKKPVTYVPGATPSITKKTRAASKPKPTTRTTRQTAAKKTPKAAPKKTTRSSAAKKTAPVKRTTEKRAPQAKAKTPTTAPKRVVTKKSAAKRAAARGQPKYVDMIIECIKAMRKKNGSSRQAIEKYVEENYPQRPDSKKWVRITLHKLIEDGVIEKSRASYKLPPKNKSASVQTKPKATKKAAPRVTKAAKKPKAPKTPKKTAPAATSTSVPSTTPVETSPPKPVWQYNHNGWKNYAPEASDLVEVQYQEWIQNNQMFDVRSVKSGTWEYNVDFRRMVQINIQHPDHTERQIRRHSE